jgi:hypothetical protein
MNKNYFHFNGNQYYTGTVVAIKEEAKQHVGFCSMLKFVDYNIENDLCNFVSLYDTWHSYTLTDEQLKLYIEYVAKAYVATTRYEQTHKVEPKYIDGIVSAWIWYILIMIFALFLKGIENVIGLWSLASIVFWSWRCNKMNGG